MENISLILGDSSDIYEFSSKQVDVLDETWDGSWTISESMGDTPILEGDLIKNENIYNDDSLTGEEIIISYKLIDPKDGMKVEYVSEEIDGILTITGSITLLNEDKIIIPFVGEYITFTVKGKFLKYSRTKMVKTDDLGNFVAIIDLNNTIKTPEKSFFIFQLMPSLSERLEEKTYILSIEIRKKDINDELEFRKEIYHAKLKMTKQGVI